MKRQSLFLEILLAFATGIGKLIFMDWLNWKFPFIVVIIFLWSFYVWRRFRQDPTILQKWGFRWDNFSNVVKLMLPFGIVSVSASLVVGYWRDTLNLSWHIIPILILYPIWGTIQQFLVISLVAGNLNELKLKGWNKFLVILVAALLFGLVHYPYFWLMGATFVLALFYGYIFLKERNVYAMGLYHGWLGAIFFYTVVGRDPFIEVIGKYFNQ
jgi:membrane protease YdiL (CAAX protease family)